MYDCLVIPPLYECDLFYEYCLVIVSSLLNYSMCVRDRMKVYIRAEWLINVSSLSLVSYKW
jgi:hypothetical protein